MKEGSDDGEFKNEEEEINLKNKDINNLQLEVSEIKENVKSCFCSDVSLDEKRVTQELNKSNKNSSKNIYDNNTYNIKNFLRKEKNNNKNINNNNINEDDLKEIDDTYNDLKNSIVEKKVNNNANNVSIDKNINDENKNIESNIKIITYIWKSKMLISGYYEFEILFTKKDINKNKMLIQRTIYRSYHDIEILYQGLVTYNPGCLIPKIPEKSFWEKNNEIVEERKIQLENYLGYICKHIYLSKNPIFLIFISDEFERYREKIKDNNESYSLYSLIKFGFNESYKYSKDLIFNRLLSSSSSNNESYKEDPNSKIEMSDKRLRDEKLRLEKIIKGTENFITALNEEITSVLEKIESMKNLHKISEILKDSNFRVELNQNNIDEKFIGQKNFFSMESIVYLKMSENYENYIKTIKEIYKNLIKYKEVTEALIEAFIRKEKVDLELRKEKNAEFFVGENKFDKIKEMAENVRQIEIQFFEELSNYHKNIENMFSNYANNYINIKNSTDRQNQIILMNKSFIATQETNGINIKEN